MSRKAIQYAAIPSSSSRSAPSLSRNSPSPSSESTSRLNLHTLVEPGSGKTPNTRRQQSRQQECGTGNGMGKGGRVNGASGGTEGQADEGSECEEEADDDDEADDPAVLSPVEVKTQVLLKDSQRSESTNGDQGGTRTNINHLTGQRKRSIDDVTSTDDDHLEPAGPEDNSTVNEDDEPDYPRKRVAKKIATTTDGILMYAGSKESDFEDYDGQTDTDDQADISDEDEDDIENEEEEAIIREFEEENKTYNTSFDTLSKDAAIADILGPHLGGAMEDLDNELFDTQWNEPHRFDDMHWGHGPKSDLFSSNFAWDPELFSNPSNQVTPDITPRQSFSVPTIQKSAQTISDEEPKSSEDESSIDTFFFDNIATMNQQLASTNGKGWSDETDDDVDLLQYFFSSNSSGEGESADDSDDEDSSGNESEGDGETTDEDEDLPTPLPGKKSALQDPPTSPTPTKQPQIIHLDNNNASPSKGPKLCSWIADPSRPICVVENWKTTILLPETDKRFSLSGASEGYSSTTVAPLYDSESEQSSVQAVFDPTLSGLLEAEGGVLNGSDVLGPPEAFFPYTAVTDVSNFLAEGSTEEDLLDEGEAQLEIGDFLCLSGEEEDDEEDTTGLMSMSEDSMEEDEDQDAISPKTDTPEKMLSRFRKVSVTAFRKRQVQHNPKNQKWQHSHGGKGDSRLMDTLVAPAKARKIRGRFLNSRGGFNAAVTPKRKTNSRWG